jgi:nucleoside-diphosphate-sugar epimerase
MRILVTGATGKVGSRLVPWLLEGNDRVRVLVRQPEQGDALRARGVEVAVGDLLEPDTITPAVAGIDAIVHLAAFFRGATPEQARAVNLTGTLNLARAALCADVSRFLFISTNLVYGPGRGRPAREDDPGEPGGAYPASKLEAEAALQELHRGEGLAVRTLRLAFVYGDQDPHLPELLPRIRTWPAAKRLHLVHHADVAQAVQLALAAPGIDGRTFNVADDAPATAGEICRLYEQPMSEEGSRVPDADPWEGIVDTARIRTELGFRPRYPSLQSARAAGAL